MITTQKPIPGAIQHTPGLWKYEQRYTQVWGKSVGGCNLEENEHLIADVRGWGHLQYLKNGADIQDANGRLIAAAPDLLEALVKMMFQLECKDQDGIVIAIAMARAAIAKAIGEKE